jgi:hypothetical protein
MTSLTRAVTGALVALAVLSAAACVEEGIGMKVPPTGARWSGGGTGTPDVFVGGTPVYR